MDPRLQTRYSLAKPAATHRRPASCAEVNCKYYREGWQMSVLPGTPLGDRQVHLIKQSGRRYTMPDRVAGGALLFQFEPGQNCYGTHTVAIERPAFYLVRQGSGPTVHHKRPADWVEDFSTHLDKIREQ